MKKRTALVVALVVFVSFASFVFARFGYYQLLNSTYKNIAGSRIDFCLCHLDKNGGGPRNSYGIDYANNNHNFKAIEKKDSDNDGFSNIDEINNFTNPGDNADYPKDRTSPTIAITTPKLGDTLTNMNLVVKGTVHDDRMVSKIVVKLTGFDDKDIASKSDMWETEYQLKKNGNYDLTAQAFDSSGNQSVDAHIAFKVLIPDNEPPAIQFFFPADGMVLNSLPIIVSGIASDVSDVFKVECSLDNKKTWLPADGASEWKYTIAAIPEGETVLWARAYDSLGNVSQPAFLRFRLEFDQVATPTISYPVQGLETESDSLTISGNLAPPAIKIGVVFDGAPETWAQIDGSFWMLDVGSIKPGKHTIVACAYDQLNRRSEKCAEVEFTYAVHDVTPPVVTVSSPKNNSEMELGDLVVTGIATDDISGVEKVEASIDGKNWQVTSDSRFSFNFQMKEAGQFQIFVRATDKSGNFNGLPVIINVIVLPQPKMMVTDPDQTSLATGDFWVIVTLSRKSMPEPKIELTGNTKDFSISKVKELTWKIDAKLGAGSTKVTISSAGFTKTFDATYKVTIEFTIGKNTMITNGASREISVAPTLVGGSTFIPFRVIGEAMNAKVEWDSDTKTATYVLGQHSYSMIVGSTNAFVDGKPIPVSKAPLIVKGSLMIPIRVFSDILGGSIAYDNATKHITLVYPK